MMWKDDLLNVLERKDSSERQAAVKDAQTAAVKEAQAGMEDIGYPDEFQVVPVSNPWDFAIRPAHSNGNHSGGK